MGNRIVLTPSGMKPETAIREHRFPDELKHLDCGHLNEPGKRHVATQFLIALTQSGLWPESNQLPLEKTLRGTVY